VLPTAFVVITLEVCRVERKAETADDDITTEKRRARMPQDAPNDCPGCYATLVEALGGASAKNLLAKRDCDQHPESITHHRTQRPPKTRKQRGTEDSPDRPNYKQAPKYQDNYPPRASESARREKDGRNAEDHWDAEQQQLDRQRSRLTSSAWTQERNHYSDGGDETQRANKTYRRGWNDRLTGDPRRGTRRGHRTSVLARQVVLESADLDSTSALFVIRSRHFW